MLAAGTVGACAKNSVSSADDYEGVGRALEDQDPSGSPAPAEQGQGASRPATKAAVQGVDVTGMTLAQHDRFHQMVDTLASPCGKAHSLRTSVAGDADCKRAVFAARYVARLVADDYDGVEIRAAYEARYRAEAKSFDVAAAPSRGPSDARVRIVEFMDYGCPHCAEFAPMLDDVADKYSSDVVVYIKHFPLSGHPDSGPAARAAIAAQRQGKFWDMHHMLLANQGRQSRKDLFAYAQALGLDMARFEQDFGDPAAERQVVADKQEGVAAGLTGTPALYINGRELPELSVEEIVDWIEEELAVNR